MTTSIEAAVASKLLSQRSFRPPARLTNGEVPRNLERDYQSKMLAFVSIAEGIINKLLIPRLEELQAAAGVVVDSARLDDSMEETLASILKVARGSFEQLTGRERIDTPEDMAAKVSPIQKAETIRQFKQLLGVDMFLADANLESVVKPFITENVGLIKSIGDEYFDQIEGVVLQKFKAGQRASVVADAIAERTGVAESRAKLIGRDQVGKLWGDLARTRQTEAGIGTYTWRTSGDERVRSAHQELNGKVFSWDKPPPEGHPGQPIQCRCWAEPNITDVINELEKKAGGVEEPPVTPAPPPVLVSVPAPVPVFVPEPAPAPVPVPVARPVTVAIPAQALPQLPDLTPAELEKFAKHPVAPREAFSSSKLKEAVTSPIRSKKEGRPLGLTAPSEAQQLEIRRQGLALAQMEGMASNDILESRLQAGNLKVIKSYRIAGSHHSVTGQMELTQARMDGLALLMDDAKKVVSNLDDQKNIDAIKGLRTLLHETAHGCSPMVWRLYGKIEAFEEATTELAARLATQRALNRMTGASLDIVSSVIGDKKGVGSYNKRVNALVDSITRFANEKAGSTTAFSIEKVREVAAQASIDMRKGSFMFGAPDPTKAQAQINSRMSGHQIMMAMREATSSPPEQVDAYFKHFTKQLSGKGLGVDTPELQEQLAKQLKKDMRGIGED